MKYGVVLPNQGVCADPRALAELARDAERSGWDGVFIWDTLAAGMDDPRNLPACDPWVALGLIASTTSRIRIGTMVTPLTRRRPWKLAREAVSVDIISGGRLILPVGLGSIDDGGYAKVHEELDRRTRAEMLDEALAILDALWSGRKLTFQGRHYQVDDLQLLPRPIQQPRIPIWVVGVWDRAPSMRRALRWDGVLPSVKDSEDNWREMTPDDIRSLRRRIVETLGIERPYDIVMEGNTDPTAAGADRHLLHALDDAGVTWWLEAVWEFFYEHPGEIAPMRRRIEAGPPN